MKQIFCIWAVVLGILFAVVTGCSQAPDLETVDIARVLSGEEDPCYERALAPRSLVFPRDHGPHERFKTEWWYYTGNFEDKTGRHFGFQLTFFRQALACKVPEGDSKWRTRQLYFAHFAVTDTETRRFYAARRLNRGALGLAGAESAPFRVWLDHWKAAEIPGSTGGRQLWAEDRDDREGEQFSIDLSLIPTKPLIRQGQNGWSKKGAGPTDAGYYYSMPGLV